MSEQKSSALVAILMGSKSDWETMRHSVETLNELDIPNEYHVLSAHRTPDATADFTRKAAGRGLRVIIAGAGVAAHLAGVIAAYTWLPVLGVPIQSQALQDSIRCLMVQMPGGIPVGTLAIGSAGAKNAALPPPASSVFTTRGFGKISKRFGQTDTIGAASPYADSSFAHGRRA
jgi:phosphoribosylaminoimidazole carboxylase PurE protein